MRKYFSSGFVRSLSQNNHLSWRAVYLTRMIYTALKVLVFLDGIPVSYITPKLILIDESRGGNKTYSYNPSNTCVGHDM